MTALVRVDAGVAAVFVYWGRWAAQCVACGMGEVHLKPYRPSFDCSACGAICELLWPDEAKAQAVARLLTMRPDYQSRNWRPGETLHELMMDNATHGLFDHVPLEAGQGFTVDDESIRFDTLPQILPTGTDVKAVTG